MQYSSIVPLLVLFAFSQNPVPSGGKTGEPQQKESQSTQRPASTDQRGTEQAPLVVKTIPSQKTQEEAAQDAEDRKDKAANDRNLVKFTLYLVIVTGILAGIGFLQLIVFGLQARRLRQTVEAASEQSEAMERSIAEANRSASAMEEVARHIGTSAQTALEQSKSMEKSVEEAKRAAAAMETIAQEIAVSSKAATASVSAIGQQMRAYICVVIGSAVYQERAKNLKFQAVPSVVNAGLTPAHKVSFRADAAILPIPLPENFTFPLPDIAQGTSVIGPRQNITVSPMVKDFVDDAEVEGIKSGQQGGKGLYAWGIFTYEDIFGKPQYTKFRHLYTWLADGKTTWGYYDNRHNDAS